METITFKVHLITLTFPRNTLATIFKSFFNSLCFLFFFAYFSFEHIMHGHIYEREREREREKEREREREREKKYPIMLSQKYHNFAMPKHTDVIS